MERQRKTEDVLEGYRSILKFLSESTDDCFFLLDMETQQLYLPDSIQKDYELLRGNLDYCMMEDWYSIVHPKDLPALKESIRRVEQGEKILHDVEYRIINRSGEIVWVSCRGKIQQDDQGKPKWMIGRVSDSVSRDKADRLTGAFNMDMLKKEIDDLLESETEGYLLLVDVDDQKSINLKNGQKFGDRVLKHVAESMEAATGGDQRIYRMNGDCFAVNLPGKDAEAVSAIFAQLRRRLEGKCTLSGGCVPFQTYKVPDAGTIFQYAENSVDYAKAHGKNILWFFSAEDYEKDLAVLELKEDLRRSVRDGFRGFCLYYQPQVVPRTYQLHGAEALLRYHSPRRGWVGPQEFIPILEETQMICAVGMWVLETALAQCRIWREYEPQFCVSVNMSYAQLDQKTIVEDVLDALRRSGLPGSALTIEVTENGQLLNYANLNKIFRRWKQHGINISIDDFGTGYSGLGRMKEMEVDEIKIDRCFVSNIQHSAYNYRLLSNMLDLAEGSRIRVCCEGVETTEELAVLEELRPKLLQGFLFSKPCDTKRFEDTYLNVDNPLYLERKAREESYRRSVHDYGVVPAAEWPEEEIIQAIMEAENDIFYVSDLETYELYYLNPAGQRMLGQRDYRGKKCYKALQGLDEPCPFCTNKHLKEDDFYVWDQVNEYCGRHFVLKDKLMNFRGKQVRMEVALDVTKHEIVSQNLQERLSFANRVVEYTQILSENADYGSAVQHVLAAVGEFYQADRAYLFEPEADGQEYWKNTYEWCRSNVTPQMENLQKVPTEALERWIRLFHQNRSVIIFNLDALQKSNPMEWQMLKAQDITRLIAVPMLINGELIATIGIDNPRYSIHDDSQVRVLSYFLVNRVRQERSEMRLREMLSEDYTSVLTAVGVGLWIIKIDKQTKRCRMLADDNMCRILGITEALTPEECYQYWYNGINDGYYHYIHQAIESMVNGHKVVQLEYTWKHPMYSEVLVQCAGVRVEDEDGMICLKGYHRIISDTDRLRPLPDVHQRDIFEYNELSKTIFFHTDRSLILGEENHETDFPQCWIDKEIVHPHFALELQEAFNSVCLKSDLVLPEILLKGKQGIYEWFKLILRHLGQEQQDLNTVAAMLEPTGAERVKELEAMRTSRFYRALLSEAIAYAEVDLESGQLKSLGGLWRCYEQDYLNNSRRFSEVLEKQLVEYLPAEEVSEFRRVCSREGWEEMFRSGQSSRRFCYQRPVGKEAHWVEMVIHIFREDVTQNVYSLLYLKDINAEKERSIAQDKAANRDQLTGVYNRGAFERMVTEYMTCNGPDTRGVLMLLDIDNFKLINDNKGHLVGDQALQEIAQILRTMFRQEDIVGRLGGDEFLVFIKDPVDKATLRQRLSRLQEKLDASTEFSLSSSIGVTFVRADDFQYKRSLGEADAALYYGKESGKHRFFFFEDLKDK